ncbi:MAG: hypothetical protein KJ927_12900, partial [Candidatus Eisenbacteria bacterium]|nr:hypothetical protein [Candidatus Eisenbacteria bacterium]
MISQASSSARGTRWLDIKEKGTLFGLRFVLAITALLGRWGARVLLIVVALYYTLFHGDARRASAAYLALISGRRPTFRRVWRHILTFAEVTLDRVFFLRGRYEAFEVVSRGGFTHLERLRDSGRGGLLLCAHVGSSEAMRAQAANRALPIHVLAYLRNARMINAIMREISPALADRIVEIEPGSAAGILDVEERIDAGQIIALMGDRTGLNDKHTTVEFMGAPACFPTGPYLLAALLRCPIFFAVGLYTPPNRYDFYCEPLFDHIELPRAGRDAILAQCAQRYAERLEHYCRLAPYNWFN